MKKYQLVFSFIILLLLNNHLHSQTIIFLGYTSGQIIPVDTVVFGFANNATVGIDEALGEVDITDHPTDSFDLRVIQRTAEDFECLYDENAEPVYFSSSFESKINVRPVIPDSEEENSLYFEVVNYSNNFTGGFDILLVDYKRDLFDPLDEYFMGFQPNFDCDPDNNSFLGFNLFGSVSDPLVSLVLTPKPLGSDDDWYTHFYFKLKRDLTTNTSESALPSYKVYPNPANEFINLEGYQNEAVSYELYNIQGQLVKKGNLLTTQTTININDLTAGSYVVKILTDSGRTTGRSLLTVY